MLTGHDTERRVLTTSISEYHFKYKNLNYQIFDVGRQSGKRQKWIQCFNRVTAVGYVVDISSFNMTLLENNRTNQLEESLQLFRQIWINRYLYYIPIILYLNKYDIFARKIIEEQCKLEDYFPDYKTYQQPTQIEKYLVVADEHSEVTRAKMFILEQFINIIHEQLEDSMEIANRYEAKLAARAADAIEAADELDFTKIRLPSPPSEYGPYKFCLPFFTCAIDTDNIKRVFKACSPILKKELEPESIIVL